MILRANLLAWFARSILFLELVAILLFSSGTFIPRALHYHTGLFSGLLPDSHDNYTLMHSSVWGLTTDK